MKAIYRTILGSLLIGLSFSFVSMPVFAEAYGGDNPQMIIIAPEEMDPTVTPVTGPVVKVVPVPVDDPVIIVPSFRVEPVGETTKPVRYGDSVRLQVIVHAENNEQISFSWTRFDRAANWWKPIETAEKDTLIFENVTQDCEIMCDVSDGTGARISVTFTIRVSKDTEKCGDSLDWSLENGILTISGTGEMYNYYAQDGFGPPWSNQIDEIQTVVISSGVESIGGYAFTNAEKITSVSIPDSTWLVGDHAFQGSGLTDVYLPDSNFLNIQRYAFEGCQKLQTVSIGKYPEKILEYSFANCPNLRLITFRGLFYNVSMAEEFHGLTATIEYPCNLAQLEHERYHTLTEEEFKDGIPGQLEIIRNSSTDCNLTFSEFHSYEDGICTACEKWVNSCGEKVGWSLGDGILTIKGTGEMYDYSEEYRPPWYDQMREIQSVVVENGVESIGSYAFTNCINLQEVSFPNSVWKIGTHAFQNTGLTELNLPDSNDLEIWEYAFEGCKSLYSVSIGANIYSCMPYAFGNCFNLHTIIYEGNLPYGYCEDEFHGLTATIFYPCIGQLKELNPGTPEEKVQGFIDGYVCWTTEHTIDANLTFSAYHTYENGICSACGKCGEQTLLLPKGLETISSEAFSGTDATVIVIPESVGVIETKAFADSKSLRILYFEGSPYSLARDIVDGCNNVTISCRMNSSAENWAKSKQLPIIYN